MDKKRSKFWLLVFRVGLVVYLGFNISRQMTVNELRNKQSISSFEVLDKTCRNNRRPSYVVISTPKGNHEFKYLRTRCFEIEKGDLIELYHNSNYDFFYIPGNPVYQRGIYGTVVLLIVLLIPWSRLRKTG